LIANGTTFADINHQIDRNSPINQQPCTVQEIVVNNDVWIGVGAVILKGVTLGEGCVIGAGSVVNKSVPEYEIWAGVPAKLIGLRS
jgi:acetyltransferase-like isoleucine patch superfamily enzyme